MNERVIFISFFFQSFRGCEWRHPEKCEHWWKTGVHTKASREWVLKSTYCGYTGILLSYEHFLNLFDSAFPRSRSSCFCKLWVPNFTNHQKQREGTKHTLHRGLSSICNSIYMCEMMPTVWLMTALLVDPQVLLFLPPTVVDVALRFRAAPLVNFCLTFFL